MGLPDAPDDEMRRHPGTPVPPLDPVTVERILDGALHEEDVPPDYRDVLRVLAAAAAPASPAPAAEAAALAAFRSTRRPVDPTRRTFVLNKLLGAKALTALVLGTASVGTAAAAATGTLPDSAQATAHRIVAAVPDADDSAAQVGAGAASQANSGAGDSAEVPGAVGLCQAYASGRGGEKGGRLDGAGLQRLADAAGVAGIEAYCAKVTAAAGSKAGQPEALPGLCRSWLATEAADRVATLGEAVLDRLATAAGGPDSVASYCADLVGQVAEHGKAVPARTPAAPPAPDRTGGSPADRSTPSHPAPPIRATPTPRG